MKEKDEKIKRRNECLMASVAKTDAEQVGIFGHGEEIKRAGEKNEELNVTSTTGKSDERRGFRKGFETIRMKQRRRNGRLIRGRFQEVTDSVAVYATTLKEMMNASTQIDMAIACPQVGTPRAR